MYCIDKGISDLTRLEQEQIDDYVDKAKEEPFIKNRYHQIVDKAQRILFVQSKDINWEANVWHLERFQFDVSRYDPTRPVKRISFLDILDMDNREYLKMYVKYQLGVSGLFFSVEPICNSTDVHAFVHGNGRELSVFYFIAVVRYMLWHLQKNPVAL